MTPVDALMGAMPVVWAAFSVVARLAWRSLAGAELTRLGTAVATTLDTMAVAFAVAAGVGLAITWAPR